MGKIQNYSFIINDAFSQREHLLAKFDLPLSISNNIREDFVLREYQIEALKRLYYYLDKDRDGILFPEKSNHLAYNMATGSGKTLVMAGIILYLYEKGYRNFLFFSTSRQIIEKTRENFLNKASSKYLFNQDININNKKVFIKEVDSFEKSSSEDINIYFTTINGLHSKIQNVGENQITLDDFENYKTVIIGDQAHHFNVNTKQKELTLWNSKNWENTINAILRKNDENMFFELSATFEFDNEAIYKKYQDKVIYKYDIREFRNDGFSKEILVLQSDIDKKELIIQAIIFNQYKQEIALEHSLDIKPVVLFKSNRSIKESFENQELFNTVLNNISSDDVTHVYKKVKASDSYRLKNAFEFFANKRDDFRYLIDCLKRNFALNKQLNVNESEAEKELGEVRNQEELLNSLENRNNQIRVVFAVNKLNEGWDVLNLFDIVRLYDDEIYKTKTKSTTKKQTVSEAQLIGRGARYCPFVIKNENDDEVVFSNLDKYKRKYDGDKEQEKLRVLEELYYHSVYNSSFIEGLHQELISQGWEDDPNNYEEKEIKIKPNIILSDFWRKEIVLSNKKVKKRYDRYNLWDRLPYGGDRSNFEYRIPSGVILTQTLLSKSDMDKSVGFNTKAVDILLQDIPMHLKINALLFNPFYDFKNLKQKFPKILSVKDFITSYLDKISIRYLGDARDLNIVSKYQKLLFDYNDLTDAYDSYTKNELFNDVQKQVFQSIIYLVNDIEIKLSKFTTLYQGTEYFKEACPIHTTFKQKTLKIKKNDNRINDNKDLVSAKDWFAYSTLHGTSEEISFVKLFDAKIYDYLVSKGYCNIFLVRNEEDYKIYDFDNGDGFCPDFLLFATNKDKQNIRYQILIEPKGKHIELKDDWKNNMLKIMKDKHVNASSISFEYGSQIYQIVGMPFYNSQEENRFENDLKECF